MKAKKTLFPLSVLLILIMIIPTEGVNADIIIISDPDDLAPPDLAYLDITPDTVDTGSSSGLVTFTLQITDEMSGFSYLIMYLKSPSLQQSYSIQVNWQYPVSGDEFDGIYQRAFAFPQYTESGTWKITQIYIRDTVSNTRIINTQDIIDRGFSPYIFITGGPDLAAPMLLDLQIDPDTIDVSQYAKRVNFTFRVTDDIAGFYYLIVYVRSPSNKQYRSFQVQERYYRISGDKFDGIYNRTFQFNEHHEAGTWRITQIVLYDYVRNYRYITEQQMIDAGFETRIEFISDPHDILGPVLEDLEIDPRVVDTSAGPQIIWFTLNVSDHLAGLYNTMLRIVSPSGAQQWSKSRLARYSIFSGDIFLGLNKLGIILPQYSETGTWKITSICLYDNVTNRRCYGYQTLIDLGFNPDVEIVDTAEAIVDFDPNTLNLLSEGVPVTVYIELPVDSDYTVQDIDIRTILLNGLISILYYPYSIGDYDQDGIPDLMVKFDRSEVQNILDVGKEIEITVSGQFTNGASFEGIDIIKVMSK